MFGIMIRGLGLTGAIFIGLSLGTAVAQDVPPPPATFMGSVKVDGQNVADGTPVIALVGDKVCGEASREPGQKGTWTASTDYPEQGIHAGDSMYVMEVLADSQEPGCGREGATVTFQIGDRTAQQVGLWIAGPNPLNLTARATTPSPTTLATPGAAQTPTAPAADEEQPDGALNWWWPAIGGGAALIAVVALAVLWRARRTAASQESREQE